MFKEFNIGVNVEIFNKVVHGGEGAVWDVWNVVGNVNCL